MAIQPIDLQTIFTQLDKVGKTQAFMRDGQQIQESLNQAQAQRKLEENIQSVNETQNMGEEAGKIKDENRRGANANQGGAWEKTEDLTEEEEEEKKKQDLIRDPALGRNLDISG
jgi:hypothetical protein